MSERDAIKQLREKGFSLNFTPEEGGLRCTETGELFPPERLAIVAVYRFEGISDVSDEAVVYGIETATGERGVITDAFGVYASPKLAAVLARVEIRRHD
jgi:hypothetical protein